jgi:hypothetical protein
MALACAAALLLVAAPACKKEADSGASQSASARGERERPAARRAARGRPAAGREAASARRAAEQSPESSESREAPESKIEAPGLKEALTETLGPKVKSELDKVRTQLAEAKQAFDVSERGKQIYGQLRQVVDTLEQILREAKAGRFEKLSSLAMSGYVMGVMAVYQLKDVAADLAKKAAQAGRKLELGTAADLAKRGKALAAVVKPLKTLQEKYTATIKELLRSKSPKLRRASFEALAEKVPKLPEVLRPVALRILRAAAKREKVSALKAQMEKTLAKLGEPEQE